MEGNIVDLVIVGAGPAGLSAACEARQHGLTVTLLDEQNAVGGQIYRAIESAGKRRRRVLGKDYEAGAALVDEFSASGAQHVGGASVWNVGRDLKINFLHRKKNTVIEGRRVLLATGAMERPFPVRGWTLPGVMGAGAAQILYKSAETLPVEPVVLVGCGPLLYLLASQYLTAGIKIKALVLTTKRKDYIAASMHLIGALKGWRDLQKGVRMLNQLRRNGVQIFAGVEDLAIEGSVSAEAVSFVHKGIAHRIDSSLVLLHQGVVPNTQFSWAIRAEHHWNEQQLCWEPVTSDAGEAGDSGIFIAGDSRRIVGAKASATQGRLAALAIALQLQRINKKDYESRKTIFEAALRRQTHIRPFLDTLYRPQDEHRIPQDDAVLVCRCEEVTAGQIRKYAGLGCQGPNQTKAFGRCGMGPCQGRLCGLTVTELLADARGVAPPEVGYYRIRPPIKPVTLGELAQ